MFGRFFDRVACLCLYWMTSSVAMKRHVAAHRGHFGEVVQPWNGQSIQDLHREYTNIFKHGNRNAASHLWSTFLIDRARYMTDKTFRQLSKGYCAVSGSPVSPGDGTRYRMTLEKADGSGKQRGTMYYCCWPCVCDTWDFIKVDTKTITTADGTKQYSVAVIGNPCDKPQMLSKPFTQPFDGRRTTIAESAAEVRCGPGGKLEGAIMSDHDYVIISLFFDSPKPTMRFQEDQDFDTMCEDRKNNGYNSGMGEIFRRVAAISPIKPALSFSLLKQMSVKDLRQEATIRGVDLRGVADRADLAAQLAGARTKALRGLATKVLHAEALRRGFNTRGAVERSELLQFLESSMMASGELKPEYCIGESENSNGRCESIASP